MTAPNLSIRSPEPDLAISSPTPTAVRASPASEDPVPAEVHAVIELFTNQLTKVSFPEIDAASLRRLADEVRTEARAVARAREALDVALAALASRTASLTETAARAVAYARIYSAAHPDRAALSSALAALSAPAPVVASAGTPPTGKRRGRPPKRSAELFDDAAAPPTSDPGPDA